MRTREQKRYELLEDIVRKERTKIPVNEFIETGLYPELITTGEQYRIRDSLHNQQHIFNRDNKMLLYVDSSYDS